MFTAAYWGETQREGVQQGGRGSVLFVNHAGSDWVIRHYYRGGMVGKVLADQYLWTGRERTRPFREWHLLTSMQDLQLPAPVPVAAHYRRTGLYYTADLITENLGEVESFAHRFATADADVWEAVGAAIAGFQQHGFCHADLNAWNVQIAADGKVFVLDWDRGRRRASGTWRQANLRRLAHSLRKLSEQQGAEFDAGKWQILLNACNARHR